MNLLDRIAQLTEANTRLQEHIISLRAGIADRNSKIAELREHNRKLCRSIEELAKDKRELVSALGTCHSTLSARGGPCWHEIKEARLLAHTALSRVLE